jgi:hypothetical protein
MTYTELFTRNNLENVALFGGAQPLGGFRTFDPFDAASPDPADHKRSPYAGQAASSHRLGCLPEAAAVPHQTRDEALHADFPNYERAVYELERAVESVYGLGGRVAHLEPLINSRIEAFLANMRTVIGAIDGDIQSWLASVEKSARHRRTDRWERDCGINGVSGSTRGAVSLARRSPIWPRHLRLCRVPHPLKN